MDQQWLDDAVESHALGQLFQIAKALSYLAVAEDQRKLDLGVSGLRATVHRYLGNG